MKKNKKDRWRMHRIPVYDMGLEVVLTRDIEAAHDQPKRKARLGGDPLNIKEPYALCCRYGYDIALFFNPEHLTHNLIAHEVFHAVTEVSRHINQPISPKHDEPFAYLAGYISGLVYDDMASWKQRIK